MAGTVPLLGTAFLAAAAAAELEDWGPLKEATSADIPVHVRGRTPLRIPRSAGMRAREHAVKRLSRFASRDRRSPVWPSLCATKPGRKGGAGTWT